MLNYQLIENIKGKDVGLQLGETTDSNNDAHLICYMDFLADNIIVEELLFCKSITESTKDQDFIAENGLNWEKCIGVCTHGARLV